MSPRLWPVHPHPLPDELLSSWMIRLAHGNGFKVHNFYSEYFGPDKQIWNRDIDHHAPQWLLDGLAQKTGVSQQRIAQTTLRDLESWAFEKFNETGVTRWVLPLGIFHRTRRAYGQQFCPICFREDAQPYLRRSWRLALTVVCDVHGVYMQDRCSVCNDPLIPHRSDFGPRRGVPQSTTMARCHKCRSSLSKLVTTADPPLVQTQRYINQTLKSGYAELDGKIIYAPQVFDGLRRLMRLIRREFVPSTKGKIFERIEIPQRAILLQLACQLTVNWPQQFLQKCKAVPHPYTLLSEGDGDIPYWLYSVMRWDLYSGKADISKTEAMAMTSVFEQQGLTCSFAQLVRKTWGRDIAHLMTRTASVDDDVADMLIASIDHEIARASKEDRGILMRDKVMFSVARCLKLKITQLASLSIKDVASADEDKFSLWTRLESKVAAYAMMKWYANQVRPSLAQGTEDALFVSKKGARIASNGIGMRFRRVLHAADLHRSILSWNQWIAHRKH